jgi:prefoldin subunit 5
MSESEVEKAFATLGEALSVTENEITEEIQVIHQQIADLKDRIVELRNKQDTLSHDRNSINEMFDRYCATEGGAQQTNQ